MTEARKADLSRNKLKGRLKIAVRITGYLLTTASLVYIGRVFFGHRLWYLEDPSPETVLLAVILGGLVYALLCLLPALAWGRLLSVLAARKMPAGQAVVVYGRSQIAKYLPGNVFHYAGRHVMAVTRGFAHAPSLYATLYETLFMLLTSAVVILLLSLFYRTARLWLPALGAVVVLGAALYLPRLANHLLVDRFGLVKTRLPEPKNRRDLLRLAAPAGLYFPFWIGGSLLLYAAARLVHVSGPGFDPTFFFLVYPAAWLTGFVVPGASAGAGVRETVIVLFLGALLGQADALSAALLFRGMTLGGDFCFFLLALLLNALGVGGDKAA